MLLHKKIEKYFNTLRKSNINLASSSFCQLSSSASTLGYYKLNLIVKDRLISLSFVMAYIKFLLSIIYQAKYELVGNLNYNNEFKNIIITWGNKTHFKKNGSFNDRYLNINSKIKSNKNLWIVIYLDKIKPKKITNNILLFCQSKSISPLYLTKTILYNFFMNIFNLRNFFHLSSSSTHFSEILFKKIENKINLNNINKIIMPYEGQPFQNNLIYNFKKIKPKMMTYGYLHYAHPLQLDIFFREGAPDQLITHSIDQKKYIIDKLKWPKKRVKLIDSTRYLNEIKSKNLENKIFFPYYISNKKNLLSNFEKFIYNSKEKSIPYLKIKIHPAPYSNEEQNIFKNKIENIIKKNNIKFSKNKKSKLSIVFGLSTTPLLALEKRVKVIHIVNDKQFELFDLKFWPNIKINELYRNCFLYNLKKYRKCIKLGKKNKNYFINNLL